MVRKAQDNDNGDNGDNNDNGRKRAATQKPSARPRRVIAKAEPVAQPPASPASPVSPAASEPPTATGGAKALIRAGLKALGDVRGDMAARQARVFELLLGVGQSPAWPANSGERTRSLADPFGKFEEVFDQRVARSLERIGIPSPEVLQALVEQVKLLAETSAEATKAANPVPSKPRKR